MTLEKPVFRPPLKPWSLFLLFGGKMNYPYFGVSDVAI